MSTIGLIGWTGRGWAIGGGLAMVAVLLGTVVFLQKDGGRKTFESQLSAELESGNWSGAAIMVAALNTEKPDLAEKYWRDSENFRKLQGMAECASKLEKFTKAIPSQPRKALEPILNELNQFGDPVPERLMGLARASMNHLRVHEEIASSLNQAWAEVGQVKSPAIDLGRMTEQLKKIGLENQFQADLDGLKAIQPILTEFAKFPKDGFEDETALKMARQWKEEKQRFVAALSDKFSGEPPGNAMNQLLAAIMKFEPKPLAIRPVSPPPLPAPEQPSPNIEKTKGEETLVHEKEMPKTYLFPANPNHEYSYASIPELAPSLPRLVAAKPCLTEADAHFTLGENAVNSAIYDESFKKILFRVDGPKKLIVADRNGPIFQEESWGKGFAIGFGTENSKETNTRLVVQVASQREDGSYFLNLPASESLRKESGIIKLSEQALKTIGKLEIQADVKGWELSAGMSALAAARRTEDLQIDLQDRLNQKGKEIEERRKYEQEKKSYHEVVGNLGEEFAKLSFFEVKQIRREGSSFSGTYSLEPDETDEGLQKVPNFEEFQKQSGGNDPSIAKYINRLVSALRHNMGTSSQNKDMEFIEKFTLRVSNPDNWGPRARRNAVDGWKEITKEATQKKWHEAAPTMFRNEDEANRARLRYKKEQYFADFFNCWIKELSEENLRILDQYLCGEPPRGSDLKTLEVELEKLKQDLSGVEVSPASGAIDLKCVLQDGRKLRILKISPGS